MTVRSQLLVRRLRGARLVLLAAVVAAAAPATAAAQFPTTPPPPAPIRPAKLPPIREATLPNGVHLLVVESHKLPVLSINLALRAGDFTDPAGKEGLASMTADLLTKGAGNRTAEQVSEAIEGVGGNISAGTSDDAYFAALDQGVPALARRALEFTT